MEIKLHSFFVLSLPSHLLENFLTTIFNFNEFIFVYVVNIIFICDGEIYLLTYLLTYLPTYLPTYLLTYLLIYLLTYLLTYLKSKSKKRRNVLHTKLETLPFLTVLKTHDACISRYTSDYHIEKYLNRKRKEESETEAPQTKVTRVVHSFPLSTLR